MSNLFGGQQNSSSASSSTTEESQPTNSNQTTTNTPSSEVTDADRELYSTLSSYYSRLGDYDQRIASAAKTFNADYVSKNMSVRSADASSAYALAEEIADDYNALKTICSINFTLCFLLFRNAYMLLRLHPKDRSDFGVLGYQSSIFRSYWT